ncbi:hypothetical protein ACQEL9_004404 [Raoultella planticola]
MIFAMVEIIQRYGLRGAPAGVSLKMTMRGTGQPLYGGAKQQSRSPSLFVENNKKPFNSQKTSKNHRFLGL